MDRESQPTSLQIDVLHSSTTKAFLLQSNDLAFNEGNDFEMDSKALKLNAKNNDLDLNVEYGPEIDLTNVYTSKMDGVHQMIANLSNVEHEVDNEMSSNKNANLNSHTSFSNNANTLSIEHMEKQLPSYQPDTNVNATGSRELVSGKRLPEQARRGWQHEIDTGRMVHNELGWREPNHLERNFYTPNNRFYRRKKAREEREARAREAQTPMDVDPAQPAQDRLLAKRGASQLEVTPAGSTGSPEDKKKRTDEDLPVYGCLTQEEHRDNLKSVTDAIIAEDKAKKAEAAKEKKLADIAYWRNPDVQKMTARIVTSKKEIRMSQLDIPRISQLHAIAMEDKIDDDDEAKIDRVTPLRIGLGGRGLKLHLAHDDGWAWWEELVGSIPPLDDRDGGYSYKLLKPGQEPYKFYSCTVSDPRVADKAKGMDVFLRGVRRMNRPLKGIPFTPMAVGTTSVDMVPSTVVQMCVAVEDVLAFELALDELEWRLRMGIEKHRVTVSKPPRRWFVGATGEPRGPSSGAGLGGGAEANEYEEEEALDKDLVDKMLMETMDTEGSPDSKTVASGENLKA